MDQLRSLNGCRIIEGFVNIVLMEFNEEQADRENLTFPDLEEITEYLLVYHVAGLRTLAKLFPNLRVIRGNNLITDYALSIFENANMFEVGLPALTHILRGGVRIDRNPLLCFADSINWSNIIGNEYLSFTDGNQKRNECPLCPSGRPSATEISDVSKTTEIMCPVSDTNPAERLCWNVQHCQHTCDKRCGVGNACSPNGTCCSPDCVGGCPDGRPNECFSCRHLRLYNRTDTLALAAATVAATTALSNGPSNSTALARSGSKATGPRQAVPMTCVNRCPPGMSAFQGVRCVTSDECRTRQKVFSMTPDVRRYPYEVVEGVCTDTCPTGYERSIEEGQRCQRCLGACKKLCDGATVDNIAAAQRLRGCNVIVGDLVIHIRSWGARKYRLIRNVVAERKR